jgi:hypothetical protein
MADDIQLVDDGIGPAPKSLPELNTGEALRISLEERIRDQIFRL